jgi:hypothetical protein
LDDYPRIWNRSGPPTRRVYTTDPDSKQLYLTAAAAIDAWPTTVYTGLASKLYPSGIWSVVGTNLHDVEPMTTMQVFGTSGGVMERAIEASRCMPIEIERALAKTRVGTMRPTLLRLASVGAGRLIQIMISDAYGDPGPIGMPLEDIGAYQSPLTGFLVSEWLGVPSWGRFWFTAWDDYFHSPLPNHVPQHFRWDWAKGERYDSRRRSSAGGAEDQERVEVDDH